MIATLPLLAVLLAGPERDNHKGYQSWNRKDTAAAIRAFERAARKDSTRSDYAFNLGTAKSLSGRDGDTALTRAVDLSRTPSEKARALYNRGSARLAKALAAPPGQGDPSGAISDLRAALRIRPGWNEAARNLDRALRLRPPDPKQCDNPKNQDQKQDKKDPKDQDPKDQKDQKDPKDQKQDPQQQEQQAKPQEQPKPAMDPRDAQRLLDGASAREAQQAREKSRQKREDTDAPDW